MIDPGAILALVADLYAEVLGLRQEVARLQEAAAQQSKPLAIVKKENA
jgi:hypothetical protein